MRNLGYYWNYNIVQKDKTRVTYYNSSVVLKYMKMTKLSLSYVSLLCLHLV